MVTFFNENIIGLPDHWFLDTDGNPSRSVLSEGLGISRKERRKKGKAHGDLVLTAYLDRWARLITMNRSWTEFLHAVRPLSVTPDTQPISWEVIVFNRFLPKWHLIDVANAPALEAGDEPDPDAATGPEGASKPIAAEALRAAAAQVLRQLYVALDGEWHSADPDRRKLLADTAFGCYTVFGPSVMVRAAEKAPGILDFYTYVAKLAKGKDGNPSDESDSGVVNAVNTEAARSDCADTPASSSLAQLYSEIVRVAQEGVGAEHDPDVAQRLILLVNVELPRLLALNSMTDDEVRELLKRFTALIVSMGQALKIEFFKDDEFVELFSQAWIAHITGLLNADVASDFFATHLETLHAASDQVLRDFEHARAALAKAQAETQARRADHEAANFRQKAQATQRLTDAELKEATYKANLAAIEPVALQLIMPPGLEVDTLPEEGFTAVVDQRRFHASARKALKTLSELLDDTECALGTGHGEATPSQAGQNQDQTCADAADSQQPLHQEADLEPASVILDESVSTSDDANWSIAGDLPGNGPVNDVEAPAPVEHTSLMGSLDAAAIAPPAVEPGSGQGADAITLEEAPAVQVDADAGAVKQVRAADAPEFGDEYYDQARAAAAAFNEQYGMTGRVPAIAVDNIAIQWLQHGYLNMAAATLGVAEKLDYVEGAVLPSTLLRLAYFGQNVWPHDQASHANIQRQLNFLPHKDIEELMERRLVCKAVPYLLFASSLQATLFTGKYTLAPRVLAAIAHRFDRATGRMLLDLVEFSDKGYRMDLETLRRQPQVDEKQLRAKVLTALSNWRDLITNKQTGWAPARKALRDCLTLPDFASVIKAIEFDDSNQVADVLDFVDRYSDNDTLQDLMLTQVARAEKREITTIESFARHAFYNSIGEFVEIARDWVADVKHRRARGSDTKTFATRFLTQLQQTRSELKNRADNSSDIAQSAGASLALQAVDNLMLAIEGNSEIMWSRARAEAFYALPQYLLDAAGLEDNPGAQLSWLVDQCEAGLDWDAITQAALAIKDYRVAMLALLHRVDGGEGVEQQIVAVEKAAADYRHSMIQDVRRIRTMVDNAALSGLIEDERAYQLRSELEYLEESVDMLDTLASLSDYSKQIETIHRDLESKISVKREELQRELQEQLNHARTQLGAAAVSDEWVAQVSRALSERNLAVVDEMIDHLKMATREGRFVGTEEVGTNKLLQNFLQAERALYEFLVANPNARALSKQIGLAQPGGLEFTTGPEFKAALQGLVECRNQHKRSLDKPFYDTIGFILSFLGIHLEKPSFSQRTMAEVGFDHGPVFSRLSLNVKTTETGRAFPWFEPNSSVSQVTVIVACRDWQAADLKSYLDSVGAPHQRTLLLSAKPLTNEARNTLARESKANQFSIYHVDPVLLAYLGTVPHSTKPLRNFLQVSVPWTYFNPYTERNTLQPAPAEMVYGRQLDAKNLITTGGAAIIYGGRQLGKSTLLHEAKRQFHKPEQHQYAFYRAMDRDMDRGRISKQNWERERARVCQEIYRAIVEAKLVDDQPNIDSQTMMNIVNAEFAREGRTRILMCFDEIDPLLELDSANNFGIFRGLSDLVNQPSRRIKILIAGLQNVKRFEDAPNFPLPQLGRPIRISILDTADATHLVCEPLHILGYKFADPLLTNRILAITNRHPGLIHIFCHELLRRVSRKPFDSVGSALITSDDVDRVERDPDVVDLIRLRFEMTLNLDKRYLVIVYGLIINNRTTGSFTAAQAKEIAEDWLPAEFKHLTEKQFEAFLVELVGLGVLREKTSNIRAEYSLRNVNIMNLVGSARAVEDKLLRAIVDIKQDNPLYGHAFPTNAPYPSPLTFKDEKFLLNPEAHGARELGEARKYSVGIIYGSEALGLEMDKFASSLPALGEFEGDVSGRNSPPYQMHTYTDSGFAKAEEFARLLDTAVKVRSKESPLMFLVNLSGERDVTHTLDLLSVAHGMTLGATNLVHRVRVLFLMGPRALWQWQARSDITAEIEMQQPFIGLERWNQTGLSNLLNRLELDNSPEAIDELSRYSHGWYFSLNILAQKCLARRRDAARLSDLKSQYTPIVESKPRELQKFLVKTGLTVVAWGVPLATELARLEKFDAEDLEVVLMDAQFEEMDIDTRMAPATLRWLERLRVTDAHAGSGSGRTVYSITPSVAAALRAVQAEAKS
jgi:hypothetical protein